MGHFGAHPYVFYSILFYPVKHSVTAVRPPYLQTALIKEHTTTCENS